MVAQYETSTAVRSHFTSPFRLCVTRLEEASLLFRAGWMRTKSKRTTFISPVGKTAYSSAAPSTCLRLAAIQRTAEVLIGSLNCTDMLFGYSILLPLLLSEDGPLCVAIYILMLVAAYSTSLNVTLISLDRVLALTFPFIYRAKVTTLKAALIVICLWGLSVMLTLASLAEGLNATQLGDTQCYSLVKLLPLHGLCLLGLTLLACVVVTAASYVYLAVRLTSRHRRRARVGVVAEVVPIPMDHLRVPGQPANNEGQTQPQRPRPRSTDRPVAVMGCVIAVLFIACYLPLAVYLLAMTGALDKADDTPQILRFFTLGPLVCSLLDPFVYFWRLKGWRSQVLQGCPCHRSQSHDQNNRLAPS
ncbi:hypothetical protein BaRGS_00011396 [Batillaria attramentaria]|uniref:G-protein coupled receptors family 1 profile domain-containing protein n=1 Tax=Batillaria attramentaria TaxID=370345 RepID=A0ABD0LEC4_9CAEN